jgi:hypothetical protein
MRESVAVLVILASKTLGVVLASLNGTLLRAFILMCEHVSLKVLEGLATIWPRASLLLLGLVTAVLARCGRHKLADAWGADVVVHWHAVRAARELGLKTARLEEW